MAAGGTQLPPDPPIQWGWENAISGVSYLPCSGETGNQHLPPNAGMEPPALSGQGSLHGDWHSVSFAPSGHFHTIQLLLPCPTAGLRLPHFSAEEFPIALVSGQAPSCLLALAQGQGCFAAALCPILMGFLLSTV